MVTQTINLDTSFFNENERRNLQQGPPSGGGGPPTTGGTGTPPAGGGSSGGSTGGSGGSSGGSGGSSGESNGGSNGGSSGGSGGGGPQTPSRNIVLSFYDITELKLINDWVLNVLLGVAYDNPEYTYMYQNYIVGDPIIYLNVKRLKVHTNKNPNTNKVLPDYITGTSYGPTDSIGKEADDSDVYLYDGTKVSYYSEGEGQVPDGISGYTLGYPRVDTTGQSLTYLGDTALVSPNWVAINFLFVYLNRNSNFITLNSIFFSKTSAGEVYGTYESTSFREYYHSTLDRFRAFLECLFVLLVSWNLYKIIKGLVRTYFRLYKRYLNNQSAEMKRANIFYRIIGINYGLYTITSCYMFTLTIIYKIVVFICRSLYYVFLTIYSYILKSVYKLLNTAITSLMLAIIKIWIDVATEEQIEIMENGVSENSNLHKVAFEQTERLSLYRTLCSILFLLMFIRLMKYFTFSSKLSMFYEVINRAVYDIVFFVIMFAIVLLGYSITGHLLFGVTDKSFKTVRDSIFT